jgi:hypothetical protein
VSSIDTVNISEIQMIATEIVKCNHFIQKKYDIWNGQRPLDITWVLTLKNQQQNHIEEYGYACFPGSIILIRFNNINYIADGQHRQKVIEYLIKEGCDLSNTDIILQTYDCGDNLNLANKIYLFANNRYKYNSGVEAINKIINNDNNNSGSNENFTSNNNSIDILSERDQIKIPHYINKSIPFNVNKSIPHNVNRSIPHYVNKSIPQIPLEKSIITVEDNHPIFTIINDSKLNDDDVHKSGIIYNGKSSGRATGTNKIINNKKELLQGSTPGSKYPLGLMKLRIVCNVISERFRSQQSNLQDNDRCNAPKFCIQHLEKELLQLNIINEISDNDIIRKILDANDEYGPVLMSNNKDQYRKCTANFYLPYKHPKCRWIRYIKFN